MQEQDLQGGALKLQHVEAAAMQRKLLQVRQRQDASQALALDKAAIQQVQRHQAAEAADGGQAVAGQQAVQGGAAAQVEGALQADVGAVDAGQMHGAQRRGIDGRCVLHVANHIAAEEKPGQASEPLEIGEAAGGCRWEGQARQLWHSLHQPQNLLPL